tara:strand:+ start:674 stop:1195 length:522 start_codon:yes stop_codon:yes gene_type:complete
VQFLFGASHRLYLRFAGIGCLFRFKNFVCTFIFSHNREQMLKLGKHKIEFYESIDSMPFCRFNSFNKFVMLDAELGSDVMAFDQKVGKIFQFLGKEMVKDALNEMYNLRNTYHNILSENNVRGLAFACLVRKIDGELMEDFSVDNLKLILDKFSGWGLEIGHVKNKTTDVKKN